MNINTSFKKIRQFLGNIVAQIYRGNENNIDGRDSNHFERLLLRCCKKNNLEGVKYILNSNENINVNTEDRLGLTPLIIACKVNNTNMAKLLLDKGAIVNVKSKSGEMPILIACQKNNKLLVQYLLDKNKRVINSQDNYGRTPVLIALDNDKIDMIKCLLKYEPNLDIKDNIGRTPLMIASQNKNTYLTGLFLNGEDVFPIYDVKNFTKIKDKTVV